MTRTKTNFTPVPRVLLTHSVYLLLMTSQSIAGEATNASPEAYIDPNPPTHPTPHTQEW